MGRSAYLASLLAAMAFCVMTGQPPVLAQQVPPPYYGFSLCNYSGDLVSVALSGVEASDHIAKVRGWWQVKDGECLRDLMRFATPDISLLPILQSRAFGYTGTEETCIAPRRYERALQAQYSCAADEHVEKFLRISSTGPDFTHSVLGMPYSETPPAAPINAANEDEAIYDQCRKVWDINQWGKRTDVRAMIGGTRQTPDGGFYTTCSAMGAGTTPEGISSIRQRAMQDCAAQGYKNCRVFAYDTHLASWAALQANAIRAGKRNPAPPQPPAQVASSDSDSGHDDSDFWSVAKNALGGLGMVTGALTGNQDLAMQGARMVDQANGNGGNGNYGYTPVPGASGGQDCLPDLRRARQALLQKAQECNVDIAMINTLGNGGTVIPAAACHQPLTGFDQRAAYEKCSRVYGCGVQATNCAIVKVQGGADCKAAVAACMQEYPIPQ